jgi:hypothetical protein
MILTNLYKQFNVDDLDLQNNQIIKQYFPKDAPICFGRKADEIKNIAKNMVK